MKTVTITAVTLSMLALLAAPASACIHSEEGYDGMVRSSAQEYAVFFHDGRQLLVIGTSLEAMGEAPSAITLVTAVPTLPDSFDTAPTDLFAALNEWHNPRSRDVDGANDLSSDATPGGVEVLDTVEAGPYEITPIQTTGAEAVGALNAYLTENGFVPLAEEIASFYAQKGWTFLAVKVPESAQGAGLEDGGLPPLQIGFETPNPVIPFKLEAGMGRFDARVYLFIDSAVPGLELPAQVQAAFTDASVHADSTQSAPSVITDFLADITNEGLVTTPAAGFGVTHLVSDPAFNTGPFRLLDWEDDFEVTFGDTPQDPDTPSDDLPQAPTAGSQDGGCSVPAGHHAPSGTFLFFLLMGLAISRRLA